MKLKKKLLQILELTFPLKTVEGGRLVGPFGRITWFSFSLSVSKDKLTSEKCMVFFI